MGADPSTWNKLSQLEPGSTVKGEQRQVVPGVPAVSQRVALARDEWVCAGCGAPVTEMTSGNGYSIVHEPGCSVVADIVRQVRR